MPTHMLCLAAMATTLETGESQWLSCVQALGPYLAVLVALLLAWWQDKVTRQLFWEAHRPAVTIARIGPDACLFSLYDLVNGTQAKVTNVGKGEAKLVALRLRMTQGHAQTPLDNVNLPVGMWHPLPDLADLYRRARENKYMAIIHEFRPGHTPTAPLSQWPELWIDFEDNFGNLYHQPFVITEPEVVFRAGETRRTRRRRRPHASVGITTARYCFCVLLALGGRKISKLDLYPWLD